MIQLQFPIKGIYHITQGFGENLETYKQFGMAGHNGEDISCVQGTPIYAEANGTIGWVGSDPKGYGNNVVLICSQNSPNEYLYIIHGHLLKYIVNVGDKIVTGQCLGFVDTTGFSTGDHLHLGIRPMEKRKPLDGEGIVTLLNTTYAVPNYNNGYFGYIDPTPLLPHQDQILPVDVRYGAPQSFIRETAWSLAFNENSVRKQALARGFGDTEFRRMKNAFIYGYWDKAFVFESLANFPVWATMTKPEYNNRVKNGYFINSPASDLTHSGM